MRDTGSAKEWGRKAKVVSAHRFAWSKCLLPVSAFALALLFITPRVEAATNSAAGEELKRWDFQSAHMGTRFTISLFDRDSANAEDAAQAAFKRIAALEDIMSDYQADSELNLLCQEPAGTPVPVSNDLFHVLEEGRSFSETSDGAFDVTVGPYVRLWRFARKRKELPTQLEVGTARESVGWRKVALNQSKRTVTLKVPDMRLDLGGIAKGYAADAGLQVLQSRGISRALVAASGDIALGDPPPGQRGWKIGISGLGTMTNASSSYRLLLRNAAVSTSGDTEQYVEIGGTKYSHIVSPRTGLGLTNRIQATIVAKNATTTDALATAVCVLGPIKGLAMVERTRDVAALVVFEDKGGLLITVPSKRFEKIPRID